MPVIAQLAASSRGAGVVGNTALGLTTPGPGAGPSSPIGCVRLGPPCRPYSWPLPHAASRRAYVSVALAPDILQLALLQQPAALSALALRRLICWACAHSQCLSPACRCGRCQRGFSYFVCASRRPGRALAQYLVASSVGARGELTACCRTLCLPSCTYTRGFATTEARVRSLTA